MCEDSNHSRRSFSSQAWPSPSLGFGWKTHFGETEANTGRHARQHTKHTRTRTRVYTYTQKVGMHTPPLYKHTYTHTETCKCTYVRTYIHIDARTHTLVYICMCVVVDLLTSPTHPPTYLRDPTYVCTHLPAICLPICPSIKVSVCEA